MPKVSVIIPVFGVERYIERCARSLFEQTLDDIEYLFIDDCSPDRSIEILKSVLDEYPNRRSQVTIHRMAQNSGQAAVRKWGILNATGDYLIHCDSDDWVDVTIYEKMYQKAIRENADMVVCGYYISDGSKKLSSKPGYLSERKQQYLEDLFYQKVEWPLWNRLVHKRICQKNILHPKGNMGEDMVLTLQYTVLSEKILFVDECLYYYFNNPQSITHTRAIESIIYIYMQSCENIIILNKAIGNNNDNIIKNGLQWLSFRASNTLLECIGDKKVRLLWRNHFSGRNKQFLLHPHISILRKIRHIYLIIRYL